MVSKTLKIAQSGAKMFHTQDLAVLWGITKKNTLYTTIKRYVQKGALYPIQKGFYGIVPAEQLDPYELGLKALHHYAYISCETVLQEQGVINQVIQEIMVVSAQSIRFALAGHSFRSRQLQDRYLYNTTGIERRGSLLIASQDRAIADMLYFNPRTHFDMDVNWRQVQIIQRQIGYPITQRS